MGCNAVETTHNINNAFGPRTAEEHTLQGCFKKFCKGDESLEDEEYSGQPLEVDNDQLGAPSKPILLQEAAQELKVNHSTVTWHLKQIGRVKKLNKWLPHELIADQKKSFF